MALTVIAAVGGRDVWYTIQLTGSHGDFAAVKSARFSELHRMGRDLEAEVPSFPGRFPPNTCPTSMSAAFVETRLKDVESYLRLVATHDAAKNSKAWRDFSIFGKGVKAWTFKKAGQGDVLAESNSECVMMTKSPSKALTVTAAVSGRDVWYTIQLTGCRSDFAAVKIARFSEMHRMGKALEAEVPTFPGRFPPKTCAASFYRRTSAAFVESRRKDLESYLRLVATHDTAKTSKAWRDFSIFGKGVKSWTFKNMIMDVRSWTSSWKSADKDMEGQGDLLEGVEGQGDLLDESNSECVTFVQFCFDSQMVLNPTAKKMELDLRQHVPESDEACSTPDEPSSRLNDPCSAPDAPCSAPMKDMTDTWKASTAAKAYVQRLSNRAMCKAVAREFSQHVESLFAKPLPECASKLEQARKAGIAAKTKGQTEQATMKCEEPVHTAMLKNLGPEEMSINEAFDEGQKRRADAREDAAYVTDECEHVVISAVLNVKDSAEHVAISAQQAEVLAADYKEALALAEAARIEAEGYGITISRATAVMSWLPSPTVTLRQHDPWLDEACSSPDEPCCAPKKHIQVDATH